MDDLEKASFESQDPFWARIWQLLRWDKFLRCQEAYQIKAITTKKPAIPIFVSHRWDNLTYPDQTGNQHHIIIRFLVEAICLSKGICERFFSYSEPEIVLNPRLKQAIKSHIPNPIEMLWPNDGTLRFPRSEENIIIQLARWKKRNFPNLSFENHELMAIAEVLNDIGVWYDYMCMPQKPFMSKPEELYHEYCLAKLPSIIKDSHTLIIWDKPANNRGWCLLEGIVAEKEQVSNYDATPNTNWKTAQFDLGYGSSNWHPNHQMSLYLRQLPESLKLLKDSELKKYFEEKQIECTLKEDIDIVCNLIHDYLSPKA